MTALDALRTVRPAARSALANDRPGRAVRLIARGVVALFVCSAALLAAWAADDKEAKLVGTRAGQILSDNGPKMSLVWCPAGKFTMGSPATERGREETEDQAEVTFTRGFWIGQYEVTQSQWTSVMDSTPWRGKNGIEEGANHPAIFVNLLDAIEFCKQLTEREVSAGRLPEGWQYALPTEAEWEYACRAGTTTRYSFGDDEEKLSDYAWWAGKQFELVRNREAFAHRVGSKQPNPWGLYDMHGNVLEWCRDSRSKTLPGGNDPIVSTGDKYQVIRGGSWNATNPAQCRSAARGSGLPTNRAPFLGFRVVLAAAGKPATETAAPAAASTRGETAMRDARKTGDGDDSPESAVRRTLDEAIALLEAEDLVGYYENFAPVDDLRAMRDRGRLLQLRDVKAPNEVNRILDLLKRFQGANFKMRPDGLTAELKVGPKKPDSPDGPDDPPDVEANVADPDDDKLQKAGGYGGDLPRTLDSALQALDRGEFESFIDALYPLGELGRLKAENGRGKLIAELKSRPEMVESMRRDLQHCKKNPAEFNSDKTLATFTMPVAVKGAKPAQKTVKFQRVDGAWRFYDNSTPARRELARMARLKPAPLPEVTLLAPQPRNSLKVPDKETLVFERLGPVWRIMRLPPR